MNKVSIGREIEFIVSKYLILRKYDILHQNWTCRWGEIDIIAQKKGVLIFIEVKYRSSNSFGFPHKSVNLKKLRSLKNSIWRYLTIHNQFSRECRLDVVCLYKKRGRLKLRHFKSVMF